MEILEHFACGVVLFFLIIQPGPKHLLFIQPLRELRLELMSAKSQQPQASPKFVTSSTKLNSTCAPWHIDDWT
jgi:hypothetical protein